MAPWAVESGSVAPQHDMWEMCVPSTRTQGRIYHHADVLGRTRGTWTGEQTEVEGTAPSSRDAMGGVGAGKPGGGGAADAKIVPRRLLVVVGSGFTRLEVGVDDADGGYMPHDLHLPPSSTYTFILHVLASPLV